MEGLNDYKPAVAMIGLQCIYTGLAIFTRAALLQGMSPRVFVVYRQAAATLIMAPIAYFTRSNPYRTSLGLRSFSLIFVTALIGVTANQNAYFEGLYLSSSSITTAMTNLIPAITFVMAAMVGLEKVNTRSLRSIAKIIENDLEVWRLHSFLEIGSCLYAGIGTSVSFFVQAWCIALRGPLFAAMFSPLCTVITTVIASLFLHEKLYTGSLLGAFSVMFGLYVVLWGKAKDLQVIKQDNIDVLRHEIHDNRENIRMWIDQPSEKISTSCEADLIESLLPAKSTYENEDGADK
ncbi:Auxin-induced protein 5NG4 [Morus notabilis]|uniref:WAT1-related protein n=1 Tax=Morus notabilis TaxID=981085 RepID=W9RK34_9ROSA|nr:Auxin-induced protein 5NG4 [Morus notabilis]